MTTELRNQLKSLQQRLKQIKDSIYLAKAKKRLKELDHSIAQEGFGKIPETTKDALRWRSLILSQIDTFHKVESDLKENNLLLAMAEAEKDTATLAEVAAQVSALDDQMETLSLRLMLDGEADHNNAIITIDAGTEDSEARSWVKAIFRMYRYWAECKGYKIKVIDEQTSDWIGSKYVSFMVVGKYSFGYLKSESGVHCLEHISPFNTSGKRHTSFASVFVYPDEIKLEVDKKELNIDVYKSCGPHTAYKNGCAIRITHLPSGIVVFCQQEKSQYHNYNLAMKALKARLKQRKTNHDNKEDIARGDQIRSYILSPRPMVKDHRSGLKVCNISNVLNGDLDPFIKGAIHLHSTAKKA
jgi:peptide chain release factor 2